MSKLIGTAGHVDHGKTTLIQALTGIDTDRLPEEKRRGLTIDIGFAYIDLPEVGRVSIVDVPGHERFLTNMLVGALGIDVALLCVAADESVMPQTVEHFQILELLPVQRLVVAVTRADLADSDMIDFTSEEVAELLAPTRFKDSPIIPVSAKEGSGLDELRQELARAFKSAPEAAAASWYLPIDRVFTVKGHGAVVTGTLAQGNVETGARAVVIPGDLHARIRSIHSHDESLEVGNRGSRTALNLSGVKAEDLHRGQAVGSPGVLFETELFDANVRWLNPPRHSERVRVSIGADEVIARAFLNDYESDLVQLRCERPVAAAKGQPLIIRKYSPPRLLGGGTVTVPEAVLRRKSAQIETVDEGLDEAEAIITLVGRAPHGLDTADVCRLVGKSQQALGGVFEKLKEEGKLVGFAGLWFVPDRFSESVSLFLNALRSIHEREPTKLNHSRELAVKSAGLPWLGKPLDRIIAHLAARGDLRVAGTNVALAAFEVKLSDRQAALLARVAQELEGAGVSVPNARAIAESLVVPVQAVEQIIGVGLEAGELVRVGDGLFYTKRQIQQVTEKVRENFADKKFTASEFRGMLGTSRKYAIPLLEFLDARGVTKRFGDTRVVN
ncbi:MAG: selenocysteine-specific translation elongation factor [Armatimonadetes bacterium]|nr:selenocysteine-specific translation elongation factor [Armatimonadota bacterium]